MLDDLSDNGGDVTFQGDDGVLVNAHKVVLAVSSPVFDRMFRGNFMEAATTTTTTTTTATTGSDNMDDGIIKLPYCGASVETVVNHCYYGRIYYYDLDAAETFKYTHKSIKFDLDVAKASKFFQLPDLLAQAMMHMVGSDLGPSRFELYHPYDDNNEKFNKDDVLQLMEYAKEANHDLVRCICNITMRIVENYEQDIVQDKKGDAYDDKIDEVIGMLKALHNVDGIEFSNEVVTRISKCISELVIQKLAGKISKVVRDGSSYAWQVVEEEERIVNEAAGNNHTSDQQIDSNTALLSRYL